MAALTTWATAPVLGRRNAIRDGCSGTKSTEERALFPLLGGLARRRADLVAEFAVALDEFRGERGEEAEHVVDHQDLPVAGGRAADPDGRRRNGIGQLARQALGHPLDDQRKRPGL